LQFAHLHTRAGRLPLVLHVLDPPRDELLR
jgi:hypothetical protein